MAAREVVSACGGGGVVVGQLLLDRQALTVFSLRFLWLARILQQGSEAAMDASNVAAEISDGGVVVGQLLQDCQRFTVLGLRFG